jgi:hypothetical protein
MQSCKQFNIADCIVTVKKALKELGQCLLEKVMAGNSKKFHENLFF